MLTEMGAVLLQKYGLPCIPAALQLLLAIAAFATYLMLLYCAWA